MNARDMAIAGRLQQAGDFGRREPIEGIDGRAQVAPVFAADVMQIGKLPYGSGQGRTGHRPSVLDSSTARHEPEGLRTYGPITRARDPDP